MSCGRLNTIFCKNVYDFVCRRHNVLISFTFFEVFVDCYSRCFPVFFKVNIERNSSVMLRLNYIIRHSNMTKSEFSFIELILCSFSFKHLFNVAFVTVVELDFKLILGNIIINELLTIII